MANNALLATRRLRVGIAVLVAFPRSPMTVAIAAWDLQSLSGGRFELGLGSQIRQKAHRSGASVGWPQLPHVLKSGGSSSSKATRPSS